MQKERQSNIELLKVVAIFIIIISHFAQTISQPCPIITDTDWILDIKTATTDLNNTLLAALNYWGVIGNNMFFVCSAWFLIDSDRVNKQKVIRLILYVWIISVTILVLVMTDKSISLSGLMVMRCLLPTTFNNNWYITAYLLFYAIHPALNTVINSLRREQHFQVTVISVFLYCIWYPLFKEWGGGGQFHLSIIVMWIVIYFLIGYLKKYGGVFTSNNKICAAIFQIGLIGYVGSIVVLNWLGLRFSFFREKMLFGDSMENILLWMIAIGAFLLFKRITLQSRIINSISSLSMLIYIIHENILLRTFYRPQVFLKIHNGGGYSHIVIWIIGLSICTFIGSMIVALFYRYIQRIVKMLVFTKA